MEVGFLRSLACQLRYTSHCLTLSLSLLDFILKYIGKVFFMNMKVVVNVCLDKVAHILIDRLTIRRHLCGT